MSNESPQGEIARTDGGMRTAEDILSTNGAGVRGERSGAANVDSSTRTARAAVEQFVAEYVGEERYATSKSIAKAVDADVRPQEIGKALGCRRAGTTPDGWLDHIEVDTWGGKTPTTWHLQRLSGQPDLSRPQQLNKVELVRDINQEVGCYDINIAVASDGHYRAHLTVSWMRSVLEAVCATTGYTPTAVEEADVDRDEWVHGLTRASCTSVLERALEISITGDGTNWPRDTCVVLHDVLVAGRDTSEVDA